MRWLKKLLLGVYLYMAVFFLICLFWWVVSGEEPAALIAGVSACAGVESLAAGYIRIEEMRHNREKENGKAGKEEKQTQECGDKKTILPQWGEK